MCLSDVVVLRQRVVQSVLIVPTSLTARCVKRPISCSTCTCSFLTVAFKSPIEDAASADRYHTGYPLRLPQPLQNSLTFSHSGIRLVQACALATRLISQCSRQAANYRRKHILTCFLTSLLSLKGDSMSLPFYRDILCSPGPTKADRPLTFRRRNPQKR